MVVFERGSKIFAQIPQLSAWVCKKKNETTRHANFLNFFFCSGGIIDECVAYVAFESNRVIHLVPARSEEVRQKNTPRRGESEKKSTAAKQVKRARGQGDKATLKNESDCRCVVFLCNWSTQDLEREPSYANLTLDSVKTTATDVSSSSNYDSMTLTLTEQGSSSSFDSVGDLSNTNSSSSFIDNLPLPNSNGHSTVVDSSRYMSNNTNSVSNNHVHIVSLDSIDNSKNNASSNNLTTNLPANTNADNNSNSDNQKTKKRRGRKNRKSAPQRVVTWRMFQRNVCRTMMLTALGKIFSPLIFACFFSFLTKSYNNKYYPWYAFFPPGSTPFCSSSSSLLSLLCIFPKKKTTDVFSVMTGDTWLMRPTTKFWRSLFLLVESTWWWVNSPSSCLAFVGPSHTLFPSPFLSISSPSLTLSLLFFCFLLAC